MAEENIGAVGLQFWVPSDLRDFLQKKIVPEFFLGDQPTFHFLLSAAAASSNSFALQKSIMADPSSLWREMNRGIDSPNFDDDVTKKFFELKDKAHLYTPREIDAVLLEKNDRMMRSCLVVGFDSKHWPLWNLLRAAVLSSEQSGVCFLFPQKYAESLDMTWIGSWEQFLGESTLVTDDESLGFSENRRIFYRAAADTRQQAEAVVLQAVKFLQDKIFHKKNNAFARLGILVPGAGSLAREIASLLDQTGIEFHDGIGHRAPPLDDQDAWDAWFEWESDPQLLSLLKFIRLFHNSSKILNIELKNIEDCFHDALSETFVNDIAVARAYWAQSQRADARVLSEKLSFWKILPEQATVENYLSQTSEFLHHLHWQARAVFVESLRKTHKNCLDVACARNVFLRWLADLAQNKKFARVANGSHSFSRAQLLAYADAEGQDWTHLIFAGLNEGIYPQPIEASGWMTEEEIFKHNRNAVAQGSQGEGHTTVKDGKEICLGPVELRFIQQRQFQSLVESASRGLAFTWSMADENKQFFPPSDFLTKFYHKQNNAPLDEKLIHNIAEQTSSWIFSSKIPLPPWPKRSGAQAAKAYEIRRAPTPFTVYDFCLATPPSEQVRIACKEFETVLKDPAKIWMKIFLGVEPPQDWELADMWSLTRGLWAHDWLRAIFNPDKKLGEVARVEMPVLRERLRNAAMEKRAQMENIFSSANWKLPIEWTAAWKEALWIAFHLLEAVSKIKEWPYALTEWNLPHDFSISLEKNLSLLLKGRIDLILLKQKNISEGDAWVMDYKTGGSAKKISKSELHKGQGLQLALYALSLEALGAKSVFLSAVMPEEEISPELAKEDLSSFADFWKGLAQMEKNGVFGARGELKPEFGFKAKYPVAILPIDKDLLEERWELTHPSLVKL